VYVTEAMDDAAGQRDFYNAACAIRTDLDARALLSRCKTIERRLGREDAPVRHAPRAIDIDLLLLGDLELSEAGLVVPHPGVTTRRFVLEPLLELDPELRLPDGLPLSGAIEALGSEQRVERLEPLEHKRPG
jgi:2-amino-4-hydroxy-6-hydroxymethyldihydropteridine diphosphokinase